MRRRLLIWASGLLFLVSPLSAQTGGELRFSLRAEPKTFDPVLVTDGPSEAVRYLTGGVLIRVNRQTQELEPELATSWEVLGLGRQIRFQLRRSLRFSDGTPFSAEDVIYTFNRLMDPNIQSPTADSFRSGEGAIKAEKSGPQGVVIGFPSPVAGLERLFDQVAILSSRSPKKEMAVLGPFMLAEHQPGSYLRLRRNPHYWKQDDQGKRLPYLDTIRLDIQQNRQTEILRFRRGQLHLINDMDAVLFNQLAKASPTSTHDVGPSLAAEQMWFNQVSTAPLPDYKKAWFRSRRFRRAISEAINREDLCRLVYLGHASPAVGPVSPANRFWFNQALKPHPLDISSALQRLRRDGFRIQGGVLRDPEGHPVEFSLITNAGNRARERMAAMIQQDLQQLGIRLHVVTLDFLSLIERITRSFDYEACLLGLVNVDLDPNAQMNVWLSSASNHQWNPSQEKPATAWEAEIDRLMKIQASSPEPRKRKEAFDQVQQIVWEQVPFIYLVNKNSLSAVAPFLRNVKPVVLRPQTYWNIEHLYFEEKLAAR